MTPLGLQNCPYFIIEVSLHSHRGVPLHTVVLQPICPLCLQVSLPQGGPTVDWMMAEALS